MAKTALAGGRAQKPVAEAPGDRISLNLYRLSDGPPLLRPCETTPERATAFLLGLAPEDQ
ncbi:MAG: hypothetical protein ACU0AT_08800 [Tranquillimonas sp.]